MKTTDFLKEGIGEDASDMHKDHEVQMARQECYGAARDAIALHKLLKNISELQGLEGWVSEKITLAADYLKTVHDYLEYELMNDQAAMPSFNMESADRALDTALGEKITGTQSAKKKKPVVVQTNKPIGVRIVDIGPSGKEYNVKTDKEWDKQKGVAEDADDTVGFSVETERAYQAVMDKYGDYIEHKESGIMYVPRRLWSRVEEVAHDADGIGATEDNGYENLEHYGVAEGEYNPDTFVRKKATYKGYGLTQDGPYQWSVSASARKFPTLAAAKRHIDKNLILPEGFPHDVDHMPGPVIRDADMVSDNVKTKDKAEWDRAVNSINSKVFDDDSEFVGSSKGTKVTGNGTMWAMWNNEKQVGWFNAKGRPLKTGPVKEAEGALDEVKAKEIMPNGDGPGDDPRIKLQRINKKIKEYNALIAQHSDGMTARVADMIAKRDRLVKQKEKLAKMGVKEDASAGASSAGAVATVVAPLMKKPIKRKMR